MAIPNFRESEAVEITRDRLRQEWPNLARLVEAVATAKDSSELTELEYRAALLVEQWFTR